MAMSYAARRQAHRQQDPAMRQQLLSCWPSYMLEIVEPLLGPRLCESLRETLASDQLSVLLQKLPALQVDQLLQAVAAGRSVVQQLLGPMVQPVLPPDTVSTPAEPRQSAQPGQRTQANQTAKPSLATQSSMAVQHSLTTGTSVGGEPVLQRPAADRRLRYRPVIEHLVGLRLEDSKVKAICRELQCPVMPVGNFGELYDNGEDKDAVTRTMLETCVQWELEHGASPMAHLVGAVQRVNLKRCAVRLQECFAELGLED